MAGINFHPAPGNINKLPGGWYNIRNGGTGDIVATQGFAVPDRDMRAPAVAYTATIGDILATQGFAVPDRDMRPALQNPVMDYVSGSVKPLGQGGGCGCGGSCGSCGSKGTINGQGVGDVMFGTEDLSTEFSNFTTALSAGNIGGALQQTFLSIPVWGYIAAAVILPMVMGGKKGRR